MMDVAETQRLLSTIGRLDGRVRAQGATPEEARGMVETWQRVLRDVPIGYALTAVERYYSTDQAWAVSPGSIVSTWRARETAHRVAEREQPALPGAPERPSVATFLKAVIDTVRAGGSPDDVPRPPGYRRPETQDPGRLCVFHDLCACDHSRCRDGWLDEEAETVHPFGNRAPAVVRVRRCPHCHDALLMAEERGIAKRPGRMTGRAPRR